MKKIRIATGTGFWGDKLDAAYAAVENGNINYLCSDHLAELTMCILQKLKKRNPNDGYTRDIVPMMKRILPTAVKKGIKIIDNSGGVNPEAAADKVVEIARELGLKGLKVACVLGDNITDRVAELRSRGICFDHMDTGQKFETIQDQMVNASVYIGCESIVEALKQGADVVITGRTSDLAVFLGPMIYEFGWNMDEWDKLAAGSLVAHMMECSGQGSGGNYSFGWKTTPEPWKLGYPIVDMFENGDAVLSKVEGEGGCMTVEGLKEQLVYEVHDPRNYINPDVIVDVTTVQLQELGKDQVKVTGTKGKPRPEQLKVCMGYDDGFIGEGRCMYSWPDALDKAKAGGEYVLKRLEMANVKPDEVKVDYIGYNSLWGSVAPPIHYDPNEIELRVAVKTKVAADAALVGREMVAMGVCGPAGMTGYTAPSAPREVVSVWSALIPREEIKTCVVMKVA